MTRDSLPGNPCVVFVGDRFQLQPLQTRNGITRIGNSIFTDELVRNRFLNLPISSSQFRLNQEYSTFLLQFRTSRPPQSAVDVYNDNRISPEFPTSLTSELVHNHLQRTPETLFLCLSRSTESFINTACVEFFFRDAIPFSVLGDQLEPLQVYIGMPVLITENRCKKTRYVNDTTGTVAYFQGSAFFIQATDVMIPVFPVYQGNCMYYPLRPAYASTVHKIQGQTLQHVTLVFDMQSITAGMSYVAVSRVPSIDKVVPMFLLTRRHFSPVT